ncbi:MAG: YebC/PmpR family DNA-binding transcriptional regulator [Burkholderiaceae bacterium]|nr:YebC/PmpR family DNA-binding transcriptional regulator [Burkholderiaceae bacterium]
MAGHSKWANIQHRKNRQDAKRNKVFTRIIREVTVAAKMGGADAATNPRLRLALEKASDANIAKDTLQRAIQRGAGGLEGASYEEIRYEGYGVGGAAVIVDCLTENRVRTVAEVRHAFSKNGGNLGTDGSVAYLFQHRGQFLFEPGTSEDRVMEVAIEAGADDVATDDEGGIEVLCEPSDFPAVKHAFEAAGLAAVVAEITMRPSTEVALAGEDATKMQKLLDAIESVDDVQQVYTNAVFDETQ